MLKFCFKRTGIFMDLKEVRVECGENRVVPLMKGAQIRPVRVYTPTL